MNLLEVEMLRIDPERAEATCEVGQRFIEAALKADLTLGEVLFVLASIASFMLVQQSIGTDATPADRATAAAQMFVTTLAGLNKDQSPVEGMTRQ